MFIRCNFQCDTFVWDIFQEPFRCDIDHKLSKAMCLGSGLVECQVCLDKGAYVPGETIEITATVTNNSKVTIKSTRATLTEVSQMIYIQLLFRNFFPVVTQRFQFMY